MEIQPVCGITVPIEHIAGTPAIKIINGYAGDCHSHSEKVCDQYVYRKHKAS